MKALNQEDKKLPHPLSNRAVVGVSLLLVFVLLAIAERDSPLSSRHEGAKVAANAEDPIPKF